ncbi:hypothetical protein WA158_002792 [Blastocystis sp. Blastoise]
MNSLRLLSSNALRTVSIVRATPLTRLYHDIVIDHYEHPRNVGSMNKDDVDVGTGIAGAPACGDVMKLQIKVKEGTIVDVKFKTFGCGSAIASSSVASEMIKGKKLEEALTLKNTDIANHLRLPPVKIHCSLLAEDAVHHAIEDYMKKHNNENKPEEKKE